jgi:hypothetical protein
MVRQHELNLDSQNAEDWHSTFVYLQIYGSASKRDSLADNIHRTHKRLSLVNSTGTLVERLLSTLTHIQSKHLPFDAIFTFSVEFLSISSLHTSLVLNTLVYH